MQKAPARALFCFLIPAVTDEGERSGLTQVGGPMWASAPTGVLPRTYIVGDDDHIVPLVEGISTAG